LAGTLKRGIFGFPPLTVAIRAFVQNETKVSIKNTRGVTVYVENGADAGGALGMPIFANAKWGGQANEPP